jgi:hypothetical protein
MELKMNKQKLLNEAAEELERIAATVQYQTADRELALAILDCADQLAKLIKTEIS